MKNIISSTLSALLIFTVSTLFGATVTFEDHFTDSALPAWQSHTTNVTSWQETVAGSSLTISGITQTPGTPAGQYAMVTYKHYIGYNMTDFHLRWDISWTQANNSYVQDIQINLGQLKIAFAIGDVFTTSRPYLLYMLNNIWYSGASMPYSGSGYVDIIYETNQNLTIKWNDSTVLYSGSYSPVSNDLTSISMIFAKYIVSGGQFGTLSTDRIFFEGNGTPLHSEPPVDPEQPAVPEPLSIFLLICSVISLKIFKRK